MLSTALDHLRGNLVAYMALLVALSGTSYAAASELGPRNSVGTAQVVNGSLQKVDLSAKAAAALRGQRGPRGLRGAIGPQGPQGLAGPQGLKGDTGAKGDPGVQGLRGPSDAFVMFGGAGSLTGGPIGGQDMGSSSGLALPPGRYVAEGNATVVNTSMGTLDANCDLRFSRGAGDVFIDFLDLTLGPVSEPAQWLNAHLAGAFERQAGDGPLQVTCLAQSDIDYEDFDLFAIRVETLTEAGAP